MMCTRAPYFTTILSGHWPGGRAACFNSATRGEGALSPSRRLAFSSAARNRLAARYGSAARLEVQVEPNVYRVILSLPCGDTVKV